ncbi:MAG: hypothetical protein H2049_09525 [Porphyrobacter sp.]|nr:hypothetical protein [Porphyrobacter sp.]
MKRSLLFFFFFAAATANVVSAQDVPPAILPNGGSISCDLKDATGDVVTLKGELGWSELRNGNRYREAQFASSDTRLSGRYGAVWPLGLGKFLKVSSDGDVFTSIVLQANTVGAGKGAATVEIWESSRKRRTYFAGLCSVNFKQTGPYFG